MFNFAHLDHDEGIDLDAGDGGEDWEGGVGGDREEGGVGEEDHPHQDTGEDWSSLEEKNSPQNKLDHKSLPAEVAPNVGGRLEW